MGLERRQVLRAGLESAHKDLAHLVQAGEAHNLQLHQPVVLGVLVGFVVEVQVMESVAGGRAAGVVQEAADRVSVGGDGACRAHLCPSWR